MDDSVYNLKTKIKETSGISAEEVISNYRDKLVKGTQQQVLEYYSNPQIRGYYDKLRKSYDVAKDDWKQSSASRRLIASVPPEIYTMARRMYGDRVFLEPKLFKEFAKDEVGRMFLTVPYKEL